MILPYGRQTIELRDVRAVQEAVTKPHLTQGPMVGEFEKRLADRCGVKHAVAFSSGSAALNVGTWVAGLNRGYRFITSPVSFVASSNCALHAGVRPRFVDVAPRTGNLDVWAASDLSERFVDSMILPVSLAGLPVEIGPLRSRAVVVEDACHALGAVREGRPVGRDAHVTVFSFHPVKAVTTAEGGAAVTDSDALAEEMRSLRSHGIQRVEDPDDPMRGGWHYEIEQLGWNHRISDLQCALGIEQLKRLDLFIKKRNAVANRYRELFGNLDGLVLPPEAPSGDVHAYHLFVVRFPEGPDRRRTAFEHLRSRGIQTQLHYVPIPAHALYRRMGYQMAGLPNAQRYWAEALSLPIFPGMKPKDVTHVVREVKKALRLERDGWKRLTAKQSLLPAEPARSGQRSSRPSLNGTTSGPFGSSLATN